MEKLFAYVRNPKPDFEELRAVVLGKKAPGRVHFAELFADGEIRRALFARVLERPWVEWTAETKEAVWLQEIEFWRFFGYDYIRFAGGLNFPGKSRVAGDTAALSKGTRHWTEEGTGVIASWDDYERYPWPDMAAFDYRPYEFVSQHLPDGMKMLVCPSSGVFEISAEALLGFDNMSYLLADDPRLVEAVFNRVGGTLDAFYRNVAGLDNLGGFFQGEDLGFKTGTFLSPPTLRRLVFPWHARYAKRAHDAGGMYWFHSCGYPHDIMEDLIAEVKIDAFHSFQDSVVPAAEFAGRYGKRVGVLGGVDVDKLCRFDEPALRAYVREILAGCMPGRFALGSGNSVANYVPPERYMAMLDEGMRWRA